jgi:hypothetical protein
MRHLRARFSSTVREPTTCPPPGGADCRFLSPPPIRRSAFVSAAASRAFGSPLKPAIPTNPDGRTQPVPPLDPHPLPAPRRACGARATQPHYLRSRRDAVSQEQREHRGICLVSGEVELVDESGARRIAAGTEEARHPLCNAERFHATATCIQASTLLFIDRAKLDFVLPWTQTGTIEVSEIAGDDQDWGI